MGNASAAAETDGRNESIDFIKLRDPQSFRNLFVQIYKERIFKRLPVAKKDIHDEIQFTLLPKDINTIVDGIKRLILLFMIENQMAECAFDERHAMGGIHVPHGEIAPEQIGLNKSKEPAGIAGRAFPGQQVRKLNGHADVGLRGVVCAVLMMEFVGR